jgi:hypothetical protein
MLCRFRRGASTGPSSQPGAPARLIPSFELLSLEQRVMLSAAGAGSALSESAGASSFFSGHCPCGCTGMPAIQAELASADLAESSGTKHPLSALPVLNSLPGAHAKLVLDFDGDIARTWGSYSVPATPAYDNDGDPTTFTQTELDNIQRIWARVAEKFSPFNINVTTVDPGYLANKEVLRVVIGGDGAWTGSTVGGVAYVGSFYSSSPNIVYAFSDNLGKGHVKYTAEAAAHEAGHAFGLRHQSTYNGTTKTAEYNQGDANRAPVMGVSYYSARGVWWNGPSSVSSTSIQDDMAVLANNNNGFGYRADDHGDTIATATPLTINGSTVSASGIVGRMTDKDVFSFSTGGGTIDITAAVAQHGPTLRLRLELLNAQGTQIAAADSANLGETLRVTGLAAGDYHLVVASHGQYGDVGQYTITGTVPVYEAPRLLDVEYVFDTAPHVLRFQFSGDVLAQLSTDSLRLENLTDGSIVAPQDLQLAYDPSTHTAEYTIADSRGIFADGRYRATLLELSIRDAVGQALHEDNAFHFHFLRGDSNNDGRVDIADLGVMAGNWQKQMYGPANGDFNYDGVVDIADLGILASNWQMDLFSEQPVLATSTSTTTATADEPLLTSQSGTAQRGNAFGRLKVNDGSVSSKALTAFLAELQAEEDVLERHDRGKRPVKV